MMRTAWDYPAKKFPELLVIATYGQINGVLRMSPWRSDAYFRAPAESIIGLLLTYIFTIVITLFI